MHLYRDDRLGGPRLAPALQEGATVSRRELGGHLGRSSARGERDLLSRGESGSVGCRLGSSLGLEGTDQVDGDQRQNAGQEEDRRDKDRHGARLPINRTACWPEGAVPQQAQLVSSRITAVADRSTAEGNSQPTAGTTIGAW